MLTIRKIRTLKPRVQLRKCGQCFHLASTSSFIEEDIDAYFSLFYSLLPEERRGEASYAFERRRYDDLYYLSLDVLGEAVADWDVVDEGKVDYSKRTVFPHFLYLDFIRSPYNLGSIFRNAEAFGVEKIFIRPGSASPLHERAKRTSRGTVNGVLWEFKELEDIKEDYQLFALELGGRDVSSFAFPERGLCIIGSEETGVSKSALEASDYSLGRVSIRQYGVKGSINVASASAILLSAWANSSGLRRRAF